MKELDNLKLNSSRECIALADQLSKAMDRIDLLAPPFPEYEETLDMIESVRKELVLHAASLILRQNGI